MSPLDAEREDDGVGEPDRSRFPPTNSRWLEYRYAMVGKDAVFYTNFMCRSKVEQIKCGKCKPEVGPAIKSQAWQYNVKHMFLEHNDEPDCRRCVSTSNMLV